MQTSFQPRPAFINSDPELTDRFWYWYGASGRRYIHSVYPARHCPVLPDAVYLSVRRISDCQFVPVAVDLSQPLCHLKGRFSARSVVDEVHVHLLAENHLEAGRICDDLRAGLVADARSRQSVEIHSVTELQLSLLTDNDLHCAAPALTT